MHKLDAIKLQLKKVHKSSQLITSKQSNEKPNTEK